MFKLIRNASKASVIKNFGRHYAIASAQLDSKSLKVNFTDRSPLSFPQVYLQDNCPCPKCFHQSSRSRLRKLTELKLNLKIVSAEVENSKAVHCKWDDGHESVYSVDWLKDRRFTKDNIDARRTTPRDNPELIGSDIEIPTESYEKVLKNDETMAQVLEEFSKKGVFILKNAATTTGELKKLAEAIGFIRITHYGHDFTVKSEPNAVNLAYTSARLGVHTDLPYYVYPPGVQMLHCIKQFHSGDDDPSGESHLVDGFRVAKQMKEEYPEEYKVLCTVPVEFFDVGTDYISFFKVHQSPTFVFDERNGEMTRVVYSNQVLSSYMPVDESLVEPVYRALKVFTDVCYEPKNLIRFKLKEGEVLIFDNWRMLHGREGFDPNLGERHLEGCYIDWDEVFSRINVIKNKTK